MIIGPMDCLYSGSLRIDHGINMGVDNRPFYSRPDGYNL